MYGGKCEGGVGGGWGGVFFFFFQAEDGIRDWSVTGVQTCALPIWLVDGFPLPPAQRVKDASRRERGERRSLRRHGGRNADQEGAAARDGEWIDSWLDRKSVV